MQQVFFRKDKRCFTLIEIIIALLLFSIIITPFITTPLSSIKKTRNDLIACELTRLDTLIYAILLKNARNNTLDTTQKTIQLEPIFVAIEPIGTYKYQVSYSQTVRVGKKTGDSFVRIKLFFKPESKHLPIPKPYKHCFIINAKESCQCNQKQ